jgi:Tfp pilus assembly protein PilW
MKLPNLISRSHLARRARGVGLIELLVGTGLGSLVLAVVAVLTVFGARSFAALGNYSVMDLQSRQGIDQMTREIRQATAVVAWQTNSTAKYLIFTNAIGGYSVRYSWTAASAELVETYSTGATPKMLLTNCLAWDFSLFQRTPYPNQTNVFYAAPSVNLCKLVNMNWKCSRGVGGTKLLNTESIQTAQVVLRNQQSN